jgi:transcriptional regulator of acetoin/glycerol metabolism
MTYGDDFVSDCRATIERIAIRLGVSPQVAAMIAAEWDAHTRRDWGRCEPYIAARSPLQQEVKIAAIAEVRRTGKVAEAANRHGISRATMYRLIKIGTNSASS